MEAQIHSSLVGVSSVVQTEHSFGDRPDSVPPSCDLGELIETSGAYLYKGTMLPTVVKMRGNDYQMSGTQLNGSGLWGYMNGYISLWVPSLHVICSRIP